MSFDQLIQDPVLIVLLIASLVSWTIILDRALALWRIQLADRAFQRGEHAPTAPLAQLRKILTQKSGIKHEQLLTLMDTAITTQRQRLERMLPLLGVIGSTAPYAGLLGTVIGIIQAFLAIQAQNNMTPAVVSGGIATALIATAAGLSVAIPAVASYHLISSAISQRVAQWESAVATWLTECEKEAIDESLALR